MTDVRDPPEAEEIELTLLQPDGDLIVMGSAPPPAPKSFLGGYGLFIVMVVIPVIAAGVYLFGIASDRYLSEAKFIVRSASGSGLESAAAMVSSRGLSQAHDETYVVDEFIGSRDALSWLVQHENLREVFARPQADFINRYPSLFGRENRESLYRYYKTMISSEVEESTGISTIDVVAFTPEDAQRLATALLHASENLVNRLNERSETDAVNIAEKAVADARRQMDDVERRLKDYRAKVGFVDAQKEDTAEMQTVTRLSTQLAQMQAEYRRALSLTPGGPAVEALKTKIAAYQSEVDRRKSSIAGGDSSIASRMSGYDELVFEKGLVEKAWSNAEASRMAARASASRQHLYLQTVVDPSAPDVPRYPRRILYFILTAVVAGMAFSIVKTLRQFAVEHAL